MKTLFSSPVYGGGGPHLRPPSLRSYGVPKLSHLPRRSLGVGGWRGETLGTLPPVESPSVSRGEGAARSTSPAPQGRKISAKRKIECP
jgi:hypothetical protein